MGSWATAPFEVSMLSPASSLPRRSILGTAGPLDPNFFVSEDAVWCGHFRAKGFLPVCAPRAQAVQYCNRSAKTVAAGPLEWARASEAGHLAKPVGRSAAWLLPVCPRIGERRSRRSPSTAVDLGSLSDPPLLSVSAPEPVVFEFAYH